MVYEKTASGIDEIAGAQRRLKLRQRQVLILIDGKRTLNEITQSLPRLTVAEIIEELAAQGFIQDPNRPKTSPHVIEPAPNAPEVSAEQLAETKNILISSTTEHLGLMGRTMVEQISTASSYEQLKACISRWHMAIRESKGGRMIADELMSKVQMTLSSN
ncbi:MAG: hypothetical protein CVU15_04225 [Betaproteobacteria bacterium HGW-Betaproteobacteria-1]|jgi:hypothetical protein|nr:MAG: hypothetical protein CVU15_04225 [Betaproteobacteria bacterium HGW-Betaproteobacteria-1]